MIYSKWMTTRIGNTVSYKFYITWQVRLSKNVKKPKPMMDSAVMMMDPVQILETLKEKNTSCLEGSKCAIPLVHFNFLFHS